MTGREGESSGVATGIDGPHQVSSGQQPLPQRPGEGMVGGGATVISVFRLQGRARAL